MFKLFEIVALNRDVPEHNLRADEIGPVVERHADEAVIVEFMTVDGNTRAVITLPVADVRKVAPDQILSAPSRTN